MSDEICDTDSYSFAQAMQRKLERFYDGSKPVHVTTQGSTACLRLPERDPEFLKKQNAGTAPRKEQDELPVDIGNEQLTTRANAFSGFRRRSSVPHPETGP